jgi:hypothetical protein
MRKPSKISNLRNLRQSGKHRPETRADFTVRKRFFTRGQGQGMGRKPSDLFTVKSGPETLVDCKPEKPPFATQSQSVNGTKLDRTIP